MALNNSAAAEPTTSIDRDEIVEGLTRPQKTLPSKYFYDHRGSELFERICRLEEYYPTDCEMEIMRENISEIADRLGTHIDLIEPGSGSSRKTRLLLDQIDRINRYLPVDISSEFLQRVANELKQEYPGLKVIPVTADYTQPFELPLDDSGARRIVYYPGSTIGNFTPDKAREFLKLLAEIIGRDGGVLIGVDLKKERSVLEAAYNDSEGVTAQFNKNLLLRLRNELKADLDPELFEHRAIYNSDEGRIEMHLVSREQQTIRIGDDRFSLEKGETIHTENSYKYSPEQFEKLVSGLYDIKQVWRDSRNYFSVQYLEPV